MTERIIEFLDDLVATVGAVDERYCLVEKRQKNETDIPYKYQGSGNYIPVEIDGGSFSYWRITSDVSFDVVEGNTAIKNLSASYPLRFVAMVRRDDVNPLVLSQDIANVLEGRNKDLMTQLQAINVNVTVGSVNTQSRDIWSDEFDIGQELAFDRSMIAIELTVDVVAKRECWQDCDNYPDILQGFDWCGETAATLDRLTQIQKDCISDELCGACDDGNVRNSDSTYTNTVASGGTLVLPDITVTDSDGSTSSVPSVQDVTCTPCPVVKSLSVGASDTTPDLGDSITITATPSNITPTSYTFYLPKINGEIESVTQVGNTYVWTAEGNGLVDVVVSATDGTDTVHSCVDVDVTFPFVADQYAGMSSSFGFFKASESYSGDWAQVQRSSDGAYLEVGWVNDCVADIESLKAWAETDEVKITILYDSTGNGNHITQSNAALQTILSQFGGVQNYGNAFYYRDGTLNAQTTAGTNNIISQATVDVYARVDAESSSQNAAIWFTFTGNNANNTCMLLGQSGSTTTSINAAFGSPTYYLDGAATSWSNRGDVYSAFVGQGKKTLSIIGGHTTSANWNSGAFIGERLNNYLQGGYGTIWVWTTDTSASRSEIETKIALLDSLEI